METIKIVISPTAHIEYEVQGVKGGRCKELTKAIDRISGAVLETKVTGEMCEQEVGQNVETQG